MVDSKLLIRHKQGKSIIILLLFFLQTLLYSNDQIIDGKAFFNTQYVKYVFQNNNISRYIDRWGRFNEDSDIEHTFTTEYKLIEEGKFTLIEYNDLKHVVISNQNRVLFYNYEYTGNSFVPSGHDYMYLSSPFVTEMWTLHNMTSSSYLTETINGEEVSYSAQNLENRDIQIPWVEGVDGSGIGSYISIDESAGEGVPNLVFVNGFFHPQKRYLYEYNNRVKKILVESIDNIVPSFEMEIELEDTPNFQTFWLPRKTKNFKLTILDVYKGTKYDDTCISGLFSDLSIERVKKN
jgi:hypothetical protein